MRVRIIGGLAAAAVVVACGGEAATGTPAVTPAPTTTMTSGTLERSPDSGQVDRVGADDGALHPDGVKDLSFVAQIDGPIAAVFLVSVDDQGKPTGQYQADTLVGDQPGPGELGGRPGGTTSGIGVVEGGKLLNAKDGSLAPLAAGPHRLTLYVAESATLRAGTKLRVFFQRPDRSLAAGGTLAN
ncbi:hypothetical protein BH11MYX4_BH11MYX4_11390 [soil metagenome]